MTDSTTPRRVQLRRTKGWRKPENTIVVARPAKWGNPFRIGFYYNAARAVAAFRVIMEWPASHEIREQAKQELRGKNLACWCPLDRPCHADVLLEIANV
jgi:hypothetical protein